MTEKPSVLERNQHCIGIVSPRSLVIATHLSGTRNDTALVLLRGTIVPKQSPVERAITKRSIPLQFHSGQASLGVHRDGKEIFNS